MRLEACRGYAHFFQYQLAGNYKCERVGLFPSRIIFFYIFFFLQNLVFYDFYGCYSKVVNLYCMFYNAMIGTSKLNHRIRISGSMRQYMKTWVEFLDSLME